MGWGGSHPGKGPEKKESGKGMSFCEVGAEADAPGTITEVLGTVLDDLDFILRSQ